MRVNDDYPQWNVEAQLSDPGSVRNFWKEALRVRKANDVLVSVFIPLSSYDLVIERFKRYTESSNCYFPTTSSYSSTRGRLRRRPSLWS